MTRVRRRAHEALTIDGERVIIRDQAPLHRGNVDLGSGWSFEDLVTTLNQHVFFWPGDAASPNPYGVRHFQRYSAEDTKIIRIPLLDTIAANPEREPLVCRYNSGSPRCNGGRPSPRSADTFIPIGRSTLRPREVIEVTFSPDVFLPESCVVADSLDGEWASL